MILRVTGVNAQFEMDATAQFVGGLSDGQRQRLGTGILGFSDRPTITFDPRRSPEFTRALITRIDLDTFKSSGRGRLGLQPPPSSLRGKPERRSERR